MKKYLLLFVLVLFYSCSEDSTKPSEPPSYSNEIIPLAVGNKWTWQTTDHTNNDSKSYTTSEIKEKVKLDWQGDIVDFFTISTDGAYPTTGYMVLSETIALCNFTKQKNNIYEIEMIRSYPRKPKTGWADKVEKPNYYECSGWEGNMNVIAGTFPCWRFSTKYRDNDNFNTLRYFSLGTGLVKQWKLETIFNVQWTTELVSFTKK